MYPNLKSKENTLICWFFLVFSVPILYQGDEKNVREFDHNQTLVKSRTARAHQRSGNRASGRA